MQKHANVELRHGVRAKCDGLGTPRITQGPHHRFRVSSAASRIAWLTYAACAVALLVLHVVGER
jgi:hypothetical protein